MQEAFAAHWAQDPQLAPRHLKSLRELNLRFIDLAALSAPAADGRAWQTHGAGLGGAGLLTEGSARQLASLSQQQRAAAAQCPYALFDLRFQDHAQWSMLLRAGPPWRVADDTGADAEIVDFVRLALFYAWHIASRSGLEAQLLLGMSAATVKTFRHATLERLPLLAASEAAHLTARWRHCSVYWGALLDAAACADEKLLRRVQLHGLQLAAAERIPRGS